MNTKIICSRLLAIGLCGAVVAGCDSIKDVREEPFTAVPAENAVLGGTIQGLGSLRPLVLQNNGVDSCLVLEDPNSPAGPRIVSECKFVGIPDEEFSTFSFGALPVGSPYSITIKAQPFGKVCTIANPTGTVGAASNQLQISCVNDPAVQRYNVTVDIWEPARVMPGLIVTLTTENGTCPVAATGLTSLTFEPSLCPNEPGGFHQNATQVFDNGPNLPVFGWQVTATIPGATPADPVTNCFVDDGEVDNTGGNIGDDGKAEVAPTGDVTVTVKACSFPVRAQAVFSVPTVALTAAPTTSSPPAIPAGEAISLVLREQPSGVDVAAARVTSFADTYVPFMEIDGDGNPTATEYGARSHINAFFEVVVTGSPTGMVCIPGGSVRSTSNVHASTGNRSVGNWTDGGAILLRRPASARVAQLWVPDSVIRCRTAPAPDQQLRGVYQQEEITTRIASVDGGAPTTTVTTVLNRSFLALFENGVYLYGQHISGASNNGVEHGFYNYVPGEQAIRFIAFTDTSGASALNAAVTTSAGSVPRSRTITEFELSSIGGRSVLRGTFTPWTNASTTANGVTTVTDTLVEWRLFEVGADPMVTTTNIMDGAWVMWDAGRGVEDARRVFVYQHGLYNAFHMGVNGMPNLQEACYVGNFGLVGSWTRQGGRSGCNMRTYTTTQAGVGAPPVTTFRLLDSGSADIPNPTAALRDYPGRWPQSQNPSFTDGRPYSLVDYEIRLANSEPSDTVCPNLDKLTVWDTAHGTRKSELDPPIPPIVLCRMTAN
jgi:hypothetical protein